VTPSEFHRDLRRQKTRVPVLSYCLVCVILRFAILVQYQFVTETDRRMDMQQKHIHSSLAAHGNKLTQLRRNSPK